MTDQSIVVVIPARDGADVIERALDSIKQQRPTPTEVVVVDDGSSDDTAAVAQRWGATVVRETGRGAGAARNAGVAASRADLIAFLDADDHWAPDHLAGAVDVLSNSATSISMSWVEDRRPTGELVRRRRPPEGSLRPIDVLHSAPLLTSGVVLRRTAFLEVAGFTERFARATCEDGHLWMSLLAAGHRVAPSRGSITYTARRDGETLEAVEQWAADHAWLVGEALAHGWVADANAVHRIHELKVARRLLASGHRGPAGRHALRALPDRAAMPLLFASLLPATTSRQLLDGARRLRAATTGRRRSQDG